MSDGTQIPFDQLSPEALEGVIDEFVTREGTEYGAEDVSLEQKRSQVRAQLARGEAVIVFDPETQSVSIVPARGATG